MNKALGSDWKCPNLNRVIIQSKPSFVMRVGQKHLCSGRERVSWSVYKHVTKSFNNNQLIIHSYYCSNRIKTFSLCPDQWQVNLIYYILYNHTSIAQCWWILNPDWSEGVTSSLLLIFFVPIATLHLLFLDFTLKIAPFKVFLYKDMTSTNRFTN